MDGSKQWTVQDSDIWVHGERSTERAPVLLFQARFRAPRRLRPQNLLQRSILVALLARMIPDGLNGLLFTPLYASSRLDADRIGSAPPAP
jgi:hypothetical protein